MSRSLHLIFFIGLSLFVAFSLVDALYCLYMSDINIVYFHNTIKGLDTSTNIKFSIIISTTALVVFIIRGMFGIGKFSFAKTFNFYRIIMALTNRRKKYRPQAIKIALYFIYSMLVLWILTYLLLFISNNANMLDFIVVLLTSILFIFSPRVILNDSDLRLALLATGNTVQYDKIIDLTNIFPHIEFTE